MEPTSVLITISGRDRPGVTAWFFAALAAHDVDVRDVEQVVIQDRLILAVLIDLRGDPAAGTEVAGPVVFELPEATFVVPPGWTTSVDEHGTIIALFLSGAEQGKGTDE